MLLVDSAKQPRFAADAFRWSDEQITARPQRIVECLHDAMLEVVVHVNQDIATGDQIDLGERRISDQIVLGKHTHVADGVDWNVVCAIPHEPVLQSLR